MDHRVRVLPVGALLIGLLALLPVSATAIVMKEEGKSSLESLAFVSEKLSAQPAPEAADEIESMLDASVRNSWSTFRSEYGDWSATFDKRHGLLEVAEGEGIPFIPGRGNRLATADIKSVLGGGNKPDLAALESITRSFLPRVAPLLGVDPASLKLNQGRSGQPADYLWFVDFDVEIDGLRVEGARVVFRINHGNLIQFGSENLPSLGARAPKLKVSKEQALSNLAAYIGGFSSADMFLDNGSRRLLPVRQEDNRFHEGYRFGNGRSLTQVWQFTFRRSGEPETWRARVDVVSGEVLELRDINAYAQVTGGAKFLGTATNMPMPFANVSSGGFTNSAGVYTFGGGTVSSTLAGQYVRITDNCGSISQSSNASGDIAFGTSTGTNCTTPGSGGAGNTHAARTQFYHLNRAKEIARGWLPSNTWLNAQLTANVNINLTCNAFWNGSTVNFYRSGGGCGNTGEIEGVALHEYGHGLDSNDGNGFSPDNGTGETYGDFTAALATHTSCIGPGFVTGNCGGYGDACTACTGVRDIDWARHSSGTAHTVANFTQTRCPTSPIGYVGPCNREGHCESYISSEALWDFVNRDLPSPGSGTAWAIADRLWYLSRSTATAAFSCTTGGTFTSNGCNTGSLWKTMRAVDDDDGNLANGTPNSAALFAAFNRHGIACTSDAGASTSFRGCTQPAVPTLSLTPGNNQVTVSWSGSTGVYDIYRNERGCNAGFIKAANDRTASPFTDTAVANGFTYYYQVVAQPSGNEACASAPSTCLSVTPTGGGGCTPPAAPTGLTATAASSSQINLSWSASSGATSYNILRSTTSGGPYTSVGTSSTTSFSNTGLSCNTTYYYVVTASNGSCSSGNSTQASATTSACTGNVLTNGVPVTGISGASGSQQFWTMNVPSGASNLQFQISGGTGDADMYVRFGAAPTTATYNCRPYLNGNNETCTFSAPSAGTWHVMLHGFSAFSGVTLVGSYSTAPACNAISDVEPNDSTAAPQVISGTCNQISGTFLNDATTQQNDYFRLSLPAGSTVTALLNGLSVDYDLYIYNSVGTQVASSVNGGTTADQASFTNTGGAATNVYVRVFRYSSTRTTYQLRVSY